MTEPAQDGPETPSTPAASPGRQGHRLYAAAELINRAADLSAASSVLPHEDERRWRIFRERVEQIIARTDLC